MCQHWSIGLNETYPSTILIHLKLRIQNSTVVTSGRVSSEVRAYNNTAPVFAIVGSGVELQTAPKLGERRIVVCWKFYLIKGIG